MIFNMLEWLNTEVKIPAGTTTIGYRLCYLIRANGSLDVTGWGVQSVGEDGHVRGLEMAEALELLKYRGFLDGLHSAGIEAYQALSDRMAAYNVSFDAVIVAKRAVAELPPFVAPAPEPEIEYPDEAAPAKFEEEPLPVWTEIGPPKGNA